MAKLLYIILVVSRALHGVKTHVNYAIPSIQVILINYTLILALPYLNSKSTDSFNSDPLFLSKMAIILFWQETKYPVLSCQNSLVSEFSKELRVHRSHFFALTIKNSYSPFVPALSQLSPVPLSVSPSLVSRPDASLRRWSLSPSKIGRLPPRQKTRAVGPPLPYPENTWRTTFSTMYSSAYRCWAYRIYSHWREHQILREYHTVFVLIMAPRAMT